jgi:hypothetical protein
MAALAGKRSTKHSMPINRFEAVLGTIIARIDLALSLDFVNGGNEASPLAISSAPGRNWEIEIKF